MSYLQKIKGQRSILCIMLLFAMLFSFCKKKEVAPAELKVSLSEVSFQPEEGSADVTIISSGNWSINNSASSWLQLSKTAGEGGNINLKLTVTPNNTGLTRSVTLLINSGSQARRVKVSQISTLFPSYNTSPQAPDSIGMSTAVQLAAKFELGWNIGNTLEATGGETSWGNPLITESYVKAVKQLGFTAIRLPCAWNLHLDNKANAHIDQEWMKRVKEVVGYCVNNDLYVMLNIHWDGGWLEHNITKLKQDSVNAKQKALWEQIATAMRDFDEHLMFASANEPAADNAEEMAILASYHQTFVNAVRSTGGKNSHRVLIIQGPNTNATLTSDLMNTLPKDPTANRRLMVEVHNYLPSQFCFLNEDVSWGKMAYYWGRGYHSTIEPDRNATYGEEDAHIADYNRMKTKFVDKGIPVLMGEYGAYRRGGSANVPQELELHNASVDYWITFTTKEALTRGIKPFWWDTGGAVDRRNYTVKDQRTIDALLEGGK
jgi:endoglucanase